MIYIIDTKYLETQNEFGLNSLQSNKQNKVLKVSWTPDEVIFDFLS